MFSLVLKPMMIIFNVESLICHPSFPSLPVISRSIEQAFRIFSHVHPTFLQAAICSHLSQQSHSVQPEENPSNHALIHPPFSALFSRIKWEILKWFSEIKVCKMIQKKWNFQKCITTINLLQFLHAWASCRYHLRLAALRKWRTALQPPLHLLW